MDATLVTAYSDKEGAAPTWKKGYGFHPLGAWCRNSRECLAMLLRPGNAGSNTFTDHKEVLAAALRQVPSRFRRQIMVRVDGAGASHDLIGHLLSPSSPRKTMLFTCGWTIMPADEDRHPAAPRGAWKPGTAQDGSTEEDKDVAEITGLMTRAENWPEGLRWIARRVKPSRRQMRNLTAYEKKTGWRYSIICTNIPDSGIERRPGQPSPAVHRRGAPRARRRRDRRRPHCEGHGPARPAIEDLAGQRGWVAAANIAADLAAWTRLLGHPGEPELRDADPGHAPLPDLAPPRETRRPRPPEDPRHQPRLALGRSVPDLLAAALRPASTRLTSTDHPSDTEGGTTPARSEPVRTRAPRASCAPPAPEGNGHEAKKRMPAQSVTGPQDA